MMKSNAERITTLVKNPAVVAGGAAASVEDHGQMEPVIHSDMAGDDKPVKQ